MSIVKSKHASNFTVLPNEVFKSGLSLSGIGLLAYLLSLPHDWVLYKTTLHNQLGVGREKLSSAFKDLQEKGYILSERLYSETTGKFEYKHTVFDKPQTAEPLTGNPYTVNPLTVEPHTVNPLLHNTNTTKETLTKETLTNTEVTKEKVPSSLYDEFLFILNLILNKNYRGCSTSRKKFPARIKAGYKLDDFKKAIHNASMDQHHIDHGFKWLTPEFFTREDKLDRFCQVTIIPQTQQQKTSFDHFQDVSQQIYERIESIPDEAYNQFKTEFTGGL
jgi:uncharacterized phage protein (TIGR02220 family)